MAGRFAQTVRRWERRVAIAGGVAFFVCVLGCMSLNFGRMETVQPVEANVQTGKVTIPANQTLEVFYPTPYVVTPNLVVDSTWNDCKIVEQKANEFRIQNPSSFAREITWKTRGEKMPPEVLLQSAKAAALGTPSEPAPAIATVAGVER
jgi:hypothetical protein